jgi:hypothetical protein
MPSKTVEFRYLQVITNHLSGDRVTIGLAHWDGSALRFACAVTSLRDHAGFVHIERAARAIERSITQRSEQLRSASGGVHFSPTLAELAPGSELIGDALVWSEVRRGITGDAAAHFTELGSMLGLLPRGASNQPAAPPQRLRKRRSDTGITATGGPASPITRPGHARRARPR